MTIAPNLEDFKDIIKALPQSTDISMFRRPKCFIELGISIVAMAIASTHTG
jgi:hypothetical protein